MLEQRNTGAILRYPCLMKSWPDSRLFEHHDIMTKRPDVYCPVYGCCFYNEAWHLIMPMLMNHVSLNTQSACESAVNKLKLLWGIDREHSISPMREPYQIFVMGLDVPAALKSLCQALYVRTHGLRGHPADELHGDATVQNIVHDGSEAWWVDPSVRMAPMEREVDLGKLLMSLLGYDEITVEMTKVIEQLLYDHCGTSKLITYYCATHLARIWKDQYDRRDWILKVADKLYQGAEL